MSKKTNLVIVESPAKAKKIQSFLGDDYVVMASYGHVCDLAKTGKNNLGVDVDNNFKAKYVISADKTSVIDNLINQSIKSKNIYLAADIDREGISIAIHVKRYLESSGKPFFRSGFVEITRDAVIDAINNPIPLDMNLFKSQETRRILDRIIGFMASPLLIKHFNQTLSSGRVQSVVTRMIIDREEEIASFKPEQYFNIHINLKNSLSESFSAKFEPKVTAKSQADQIKLQLSDPSTTFSVYKIDSKEKKEKAPPPLITSKLQQIMARKHSFAAERTMKAAQNLYEFGYVTYIRTDSVRSSEKSIESVRNWLKKNNYDVPAKPNQYDTSGASQDAHECIRPTNMSNDPANVNLNQDELKVYETIWNHFVASQMKPAIWDTLEVKVRASSDKSHTFKASGKALKYKGYLEVLGMPSDSKIDIPNLNNNEKLSLVDNKSIKIEEKFTQPPPRYSEATLLNELEKRQIGRPATYAEILKKIANRKYVEKKGNTYYATPLGKQVTELLVRHFPFMDYQYTADMEKQLDEIAAGRADNVEVLKKFYNDFTTQLNNAYNECGGVVICEKCNGQMVERINKKDNSKFLGCRNWPNCRNSKSINK